MNTKPMQDCIDSCTKCYQACLQTAMNHCPETGECHFNRSYAATQAATIADDEGPPNMRALFP